MGSRGLCSSHLKCEYGMGLSRMGVFLVSPTRFSCWEDAVCSYRSQLVALKHH